MLMRPWMASAMAIHSTNASPTAVTSCTIGLETALVRTRRMLERRLWSFTASNWRLDMLLGVVDLDQARRLEALLGDARDVAHRVLDAAAVAAEALVDDRHQPADQRPDGERDDRQARVQPQQDRDRADDGERGCAPMMMIESVVAVPTCSVL